MGLVLLLSDDGVGEVGGEADRRSVTKGLVDGRRVAWRWAEPSIAKRLVEEALCAEDTPALQRVDSPARRRPYCPVPTEIPDRYDRLPLPIWRCIIRWQ